MESDAALFSASLSGGYPGRSADPFAAVRALEQEKQMIDPISLINKYYTTDDALRHILLVHSESVARKALAVADAHPELTLDRDFLYAAAMLHDVGIFLTDAPAIHCHGTEPYLRHGILGARLMRQEGFPDIARVCERHTGAGLSEADIVQRQLPLPPGDYQPETLAEQVVCYADKFYSKTHLDRERTVEQVVKSLERFGDDGPARFLRWHERFG